MRSDFEGMIRICGVKEQREWLRLRKELWPDDEEAEALEWTQREDAVTLIAVMPDERVAGFAEVGSRPYADGCDSSPVAFLEGWYVQAADRKRDIGRSLILAAMAWAREKGFRELASDSLLENTDAHFAHKSVGFEEVERSIKYRMPLGAAR